MNVTVTGTLGYDYIMDFPGKFADRIMPDKIHSLSLSFLVETLNKQFGGTAGNIAYTLHLLGVKPTVVAPAGNDFGPYAQFLKKTGIPTQSIVIHDDIPTSSYFVVTDMAHNQIGSFYVGATKHAKKLSVYTGKKAGFVVIAPTDPMAMKKYVAECHTHALRYLYDPAFQIGTFTPEELKDGINGAEIFIANDYEMTLVEEKLGVTHEELRTLVPILITTLGAKGSIIETSSKSIHVRSAKVKKVIDPTGAGDAYRAGFLAGYLKKLPLDVCGQMGSVAAAYTVEKYGTVTHAFSAREFSKRYFENYRTQLPS